MYGEFVYGLCRTFSPWVAFPGEGGVTGVLSPSMMGVRLPSKCSWLRIKKAAEKWFFPLFLKREEEEEEILQAAQR